MKIILILFNIFLLSKGNLFDYSGSEYSGSNEYIISGNINISNNDDVLFSEYEINDNILEDTSESSLKKKLFANYSNDYRPVVDYHNNVNVNFSLNINSLESFNQIAEKIKFNMEMTYEWYDEYLMWDKDKYNIEFLNLGSEPIWKPDLELYNSASYPELWTLEGSTKVYYNGKIRWVLPILYSFSCPLQLKHFPFDTQDCQMDFGSWKMSKDFLDIRIQSSDNDIDLVKYDNFRHNEWSIKKIKYETNDMEYLCCPNEKWPITQINIYLKRNYHKYLVVMTMTAFLTISALVVNTLSVENYRRTYILVFIPLSIIWLQLYIASKIPIIEYSTLMERFIISSFAVCVICALESGILFCILNNHFICLKKIYKNNDLNKINYNKEKINFIKRNIDAGKTNSFMYLKFKNYLLTFDEYFKFIIIISYMITVISIVY